MEKLFNIIHYCYYLIDSKIHLLSNYINPFRLLYKIPYLKRRDERLGVSRDEVLNNAFSNKEFGISIIVSGGVLIAFVFLLLFSILNYSISLLNIDFILTKPIFVSIGIISFLLCYVFVFRKDKYLKYFKEFNMWAKAKKRRNIIISVAITIMIIILFFLSLF